MGQKCPIRALKMHPLVQRLKKELVDEARRRFLRPSAAKTKPARLRRAGTFNRETASAVSLVKAAPRMYV